MLLLPAALLAIIIALLFVPSVVCSRKADAKVAVSAKKAEKEEEPEEEPEEPEEEDDTPSSD